MIQLFAKKSCSACIRIPSSFEFGWPRLPARSRILLPQTFRHYATAGVRIIALDGADFLF